MRESLQATPITGNAVITGTVLITIFQGAVGIARSFDHSLTGGQEQAIVEFLAGPVGTGVAVVATWLVAWFLQRANVFSKLSVEKIREGTADSALRGG